MYIPIFQVDAFASALFEGNPAAVCPLTHWMPDLVLQNIAAENNLSETAFFVPGEEHITIRWFTPLAEVNLCGHATLAVAHVLFHHLEFQGDRVSFNSRSGPLTVYRRDDLLILDFPADDPIPVAPPPGLIEALGKEPLEVYRGREDYLLIYRNESTIKKIQPDFVSLEKLKSRGVIISATGIQTDFVSRFFAPGVGIPEDPVTGSAHTLLIPYWSKRLKKESLTALQLSRRRGRLFCSMEGSRVQIGGSAITYLEGMLNLPDILA